MATRHKNENEKAFITVVVFILETKIFNCKLRDGEYRVAIPKLSLKLPIS